jgi:hypothetical protein
MHPRFTRTRALFAIAFLALPIQALAAQATGGGHRRPVSIRQEAAPQESPSPQRFAQLFSAALSVADFASRADEELARIESSQPGVSKADQEFCLQKTGYSNFKRNWVPYYDYLFVDDSDPKHYTNSQDLRCRPFYLGYNQAIDKEVARMFNRGSDPATREWSYGAWVIGNRVAYLRGKALADNYWPRLAALAETVHKGFAEISRSPDFSVLERHVAIALQRVIETKATYNRLTYIEFQRGGYFTLDEKYYPTQFNKDFVASYRETVVYLAFLVEDWMSRTGGNLSYDARDFSLALDLRDLSARVELATRVAYQALGVARAAHQRIDAAESAEMIRSAVFWGTAGTIGVLTRLNFGPR